MQRAEASGEVTTTQDNCRNPWVDGSMDVEETPYGHQGPSIQPDEPTPGEIVVAVLPYAGSEFFERTCHRQHGYIAFGRGARFVVRSHVHRGHKNNLYPAYVWIQALTQDGLLLDNEQGWGPRLLLRRQHVRPQYAILLQPADGGITGGMYTVNHIDRSSMLRLQHASRTVEVPKTSCALLDSVTDVHTIQREYDDHHPILEPTKCFDGLACRIITAVWDFTIRTD